MRRISMVLTALVFSCNLFLFAQNDADQVTLAKPVCEAAFTIPAHSAKTCTFSVSQGQHRVRLEGHFAATGGPHNSIEVWVMNDDEFVNWQNHHPVKAIYNSQRVTQGTINVFLPDSGKYHVVFNNDFSLLTPKAVEVQLTIEQ
jgi:hypothetical protein